MDDGDEIICGQISSNKNRHGFGKFNKIMAALCFYYSMFIGFPAIGGMTLGYSLAEDSIFGFCLGIFMAAMNILFYIIFRRNILTFAVMVIIFIFGFLLGLLVYEMPIINDVFNFLCISVVIVDLIYFYYLSMKRSTRK